MSHFKNSQLSHLQRIPCMTCGMDAPALINGEIKRHVVCEACSRQFEKEWFAAMTQRFGSQITQKRRSISK